MKRPWQAMLLAAVALLAVVMPASSIAQALPGSAMPVAITVLEDPAADVRASAAGQGAANPTPRAAQLDILGATVLESALDITFTLRLASVEEPTEPPLAESGFYRLHFIQNDVEYAVLYGRIKSQDTGTFAMLSRYDPAVQQYYGIDVVPVTVDPVQKAFIAVVGRDLIVDSQGAKPYPGTSLTGFWAESEAFLEIFLFPVGFTGQQPPTLRDRAPETGTGTATVPITLGPKQLGSARLASPLPTRQSNGEAGTFVFTVNCRNTATVEKQYRLATADVPAGWNVTLPADLLAIPAGGELAVPVVVTTPFTHMHGTFRSFMLRVEEVEDPAARADLELGIRYPKVPQPAGHHNQLWLHSAPFTDDPTVPAYALAFGFNIEIPWMNALEADEGDRNVPTPSDPTREMTPSVPGRFRWTVPLAPALSIGLDFDTQRTGTWSGFFTATAPITSASLSGELVRYVDSRFDQFGIRTGGNRTILATAAATPPQDILSGATVGYTLTFHPTEASDLVPLAANSALVLEVALTGNRPDTGIARDPPKLMPGATLVLPLNEYHDPVDAAFAATPKLVLKAFTSQDRAANPGRTVVYDLGAHLATDAAPHTLTATVTGPGAAHARMLGDPTYAAQPGAWWNFTVAVTVPASAKAKDVVDLVVRVQAADDAPLQSLVRLVTVVTTDADIPDEAGLVADGESHAAVASPAAGFAVQVALVAIAAALRRR